MTGAPSPPDGYPVRLDATDPAQLAGIHGLEDGTFRLTLQHGQVIRIAEMYLP